MKNILVIGNGIAGMTTAIKCAENGDKVILLGKTRSERSQSVMATEGINVALNTKQEKNSIYKYYIDTMEGGYNINNKNAVKYLAKNAPEIINWLLNLGVIFNRDKDGQIDLKSYGGKEKRRTAYAGNHTGKHIVTALNSVCMKYEASGMIERRTGYSLLNLIITDKKECLGAVFADDNEKIISIKADAVIIASGGANRLFGKTTGSLLNDGSCEGIALTQGVELENLEMIQYHPTTIETKVKNIFITETCMKEGGKLYTLREGEKWYFLNEWYPDNSEFLPANIISESIYKVCNEMKMGIDGENRVYLDISMLPSEIIDNRLRDVCEICKKHLCLDPHKEPIPVYPGIHYFMGGIKTDEYHRTNIKRLFAVGECSCQYHGANRIEGNSILGAINGGFMVADCIKNFEKANDKEKEEEMAKVLEKEIYNKEQWETRKTGDFVNIWKVEDMLSYIMNRYMGIVRNEEKLMSAYNAVQNLENYCKLLRCDYAKYKTFLGRVYLAKAMVKSAYERKETRGAHIRSDYPESSRKYEKCTSVVFKDNRLHIEFKEP